jgi:hypothetical protein
VSSIPPLSIFFIISCRFILLASFPLPMFSIFFSKYVPVVLSFLSIFLTWIQSKGSDPLTMIFIWIQTKYSYMQYKISSREHKICRHSFYR